MPKFTLLSEIVLILEFHGHLVLYALFLQLNQRMMTEFWFNCTTIASTSKIITCIFYMSSEQ